ncbi:MAG: hypothetical protein QM628_13630 [Propionicimonas sp.]|jgi:hypothetical protein
MTQPPYQPHQPFDPTRPLGQQRPEATHVEQFTPPRSPLPWLIMVGAVVIAALILFTTTLTNRPADPTASPTPATSSAAAGPGHPFVSPDGRVEGRWEVVESRWNDEGVEINLRLAVDKGTLWYTFMAFSNDAVEVLEPGPAMSSPELGWEPIEAGDERTGWIFFPTYRADLTLLLATEFGRQMSALLIPA